MQKNVKRPYFHIKFVQDFFVSMMIVCCFFVFFRFGVTILANNATLRQIALKVNSKVCAELTLSLWTTVRWILRRHLNWTGMFGTLSWLNLEHAQTWTLALFEISAPWQWTPCPVSCCQLNIIVAWLCSWVCRMIQKVCIVEVHMIHCDVLPNSRELQGDFQKLNGNQWLPGK